MICLALILNCNLYQYYKNRRKVVVKLNGQLYQICSIVTASKKALKEKSALSYTPFKYVNKIEFQFLAEKKFFFIKEYRVKDVPTWYNYCLKKGLIDLKYIAPTSVKDRNKLGFSNTTQSSIVCFYKGGLVTYFTARWEFDSDMKNWNILYTEQYWKDAPEGKPYFQNNINSFKTILLEIRGFAIEIGCEGFANIFQKAYDVLAGNLDFNDTIYDMPLLEIPEENMRLFQAASIADVFGAMGSWNDSPPYLAHEKGLDTEYESLSNELLKQVRFATLYAINEW